MTRSMYAAWCGSPAWPVMAARGVLAVCAAPAAKHSSELTATKPHLPQPLPVRRRLHPVVHAVPGTALCHQVPQSLAEPQDAACPVSAPARVGQVGSWHDGHITPQCRRGSCAALCLRFNLPRTLPSLMRRMLNDYRWFWGSHMTLFVVYYTCLILHPLPGNPAVAHKGKVYVRDRQLFIGRAWGKGLCCSLSSKDGIPCALASLHCKPAAAQMGAWRDGAGTCTPSTPLHRNNHPPCRLLAAVCGAAPGHLPGEPRLEHGAPAGRPGSCCES